MNKGNTKLATFCDNLVEIGWLTIVMMSPLFFYVYTSRPFIIDKIVLVRIISHIMLVAWLIASIERASPSSDSFLTRLKTWVGQPLILPTLLLAAVYLLSPLYSISPSVSFWGGYYRAQGSYSVLSFILLFLLVADSLRTQTQLNRLLITLMLSSVPVCLHGIAQHYGLNPIFHSGEFEEWVSNRATASFGNPINLAAYLIMLIPLTASSLVSNALPLIRRINLTRSQLILTATYAIILILQIVTLIFTQSRGPLVGLAVGGFVMVLLSLLALRQAYPANLYARWSWAGWLALAASGVIFLIVLNTASLPLDSLRQLPYLDRLSDISLTGGTGKIRTITWEDAFGLMVLEKPVGIPDDEIIPQDTLHMVRPLIGYGSSSVGNAFYAVHSAALSNELFLQGDRAFIDNIHNETLQHLATVGVVGTLIWYSVILSLFFYSLVWLGYVTSNRRKWQLIGLLVAGSLMGGLLAYLMDGEGHPLTLVPLAIPLGVVGGLIGYLVWHTVTTQADSPQNPHVQLLLIGCVALMVGHFIELQFSFFTPVTHLYFWLCAGMLVAIPKIFKLTEIGTAATDHQPHKIEPLTFSLKELSFVMSTISITLLFAYLLNEQNNLGFVAGVITLTWLVGLGIVFASGTLNSTGVMKRTVLVSLGVAIVVPAAYAFVHASLLNSWASTDVENVTGRMNAQITILSCLAIVLLGLLSWQINNLGPTSHKTMPLWQSENWWAYPPMVLVLLLVLWFGNVNLVRADVSLYEVNFHTLLKPIITLSERAYELAGHEATYLLELSQYYQDLANNQQIEASGRQLGRDEAERLLREAQAQNPYNAALSNRLGQHYLYQAELEKAEKAFAQAIALFPADVFNYNNLGHTLYKMEEYEAAQSYFQQAIDLDDGCSISWFGLGDTFLTLGDVEQALTAHERGLSLTGKRRCGSLMTNFAYQLKERLMAYAAHDKLDAVLSMALQAGGANDVEFLVTVSEIYQAQGQPNEALSYLEQALDLNVNMEEIQAKMAAIYTDLKSFDEAIALYESLSEGSPDNADYHLALAQIYIQQHQTESALKHIETLQLLVPDNYVVLSNLAVIYQEQERWLDAVAIAEKVLTVVEESEIPRWQAFIATMLIRSGEAGLPKLSESFTYYLKAFVTINQLDELIAMLETMATELPDNSTVHQLLGRAYQANNQLENAIDQLEQAQLLGDESGKTLRTLLLLYFELLKDDEAVVQYQAAYQNNPADEQAHSILGYIYMQQDSLELATWHTKRVVELLPNNYMALNNLAALYQRQQQWQKFIETAQQALANAPAEEKARWEILISEAEGLLQP